MWTLSHPFSLCLPGLSHLGRKQQGPELPSLFSLPRPKAHPPQGAPCSDPGVAKGPFPISPSLSRTGWGVFESHWLPERVLLLAFCYHSACGFSVLLSTCPRGTLLEGSLHWGFDQCLHQGPPHLSLWARLGEPDLPTATQWPSRISHAIPLLRLCKSGSLGFHLTACPPAVASPPSPFSAFSLEHSNSTPAHPTLAKHRL